MPEPTQRAKPNCCPVHRFLSPSRVCEDKKPPHLYCHHPIHATCQLKGSEWSAAGYSHIHTNPETLQPKKEQPNKRPNAQQGDRSHVEDWFKPPYSLWVIYAFTSRKYQLFIGRITVQPEQIDVSACQEAARQDAIHQHTLTHPREKEQRDPTWLKHTLEIKDDQNKGSQTSGKYHPAYPAHPHQFAQSLFHGGTERLEDAARFVREWRAGLSEAPGLWWYWWGLSAGQWAEHIQHGAYHCWAKRGGFVLGANERVHVCTWIYEHSSTKSCCLGICIYGAMSVVAVWLTQENF